jgi:hypothetical protein
MRYIFMMIHLLLHICMQVKFQLNLTLKKWDRVVHKTKQSKWEGNSLLWVWTNG